jgi:hypothetical protein
MGCQSEVYLGDDLTFSVCTHDPDTGVLTDADAAPIYRVYEDEDTPPLLTGVMALLDPVSTDGFYTEQIACTTGNGFEARKSYNIYVEATVDGDTGGICYAFRVLDAPSPATGVEFTYTVVEADGTPIAGVKVWFTTDALGTNVVWTGFTDAFGVARDTYGDLPILDAGDYYVWRLKSGVSFDNPDTETVA